MGVPDKSVLLVDDDVDLREMVELVLDRAGFHVRSAGDGQEAMDAVAQEMPGLILLDMRMPRMDGWQFAREFRARYGRQAPIVVLTAAPEARQWAEEIEADGYLDKPFRMQNLIRLVGLHLAGAT